MDFSLKPLNSNPAQKINANLNARKFSTKLIAKIHAKILNAKLITKISHKKFYRAKPLSNEL